MVSSVFGRGNAGGKQWQVTTYCVAGFEVSGEARLDCNHAKNYNKFVIYNHFRETTEGIIHILEWTQFFSFVICGNGSVDATI